MACPSGCANGGGQIRPEDDETAKDRLVTVTDLYNSVEAEDPHSKKEMDSLYSEWLGGVDSEKAKLMLHTNYHEVEKMTNALNIKW